MFKYLSFFLLFTVVCLAQNLEEGIRRVTEDPLGDLRKVGKLYTWEAQNLRIDTTSTTVSFVGSIPKTKDVSKDSGGTRAVAYMRAWQDSTEILVGAELSPSGNWSINATEDTLTHTSGGAGFEGLPINISDTTRGLTKYHYSFELLNRTSGSVKLFVYMSPLPLFYNSVEGVEANSDDTYTGEITAYIGSRDRFLAGFDASKDFAGQITNFSLIPVMDSTLGYVHSIIRPADTTTFYYSQSVWWRQKDKNTVWIAAETDTVIVYPYEAPASIPYMVTADGDTMFTADGDTMKTLGFIQFDFLQQFNDGEKDETDFNSDRSVFAVLNERKCTMDIG